MLKLLVTVVMWSAARSAVDADMQTNVIEILETAAQTQLSNQSQTGWDWSQCQEERIPDSDSISTVKLHPLWHSEPLRLAVRGDGWTYIYLSQDSWIDLIYGRIFAIDIRKTKAYLVVVDGAKMKTIQRVSVGANFSPSRDTRLSLSIADDLLELRVGDDATPLLAGRDSRLKHMRYIGFRSCDSSNGYTIFKYGC